MCCLDCVYLGIGVSGYCVLGAVVAVVGGGVSGLAVAILCIGEFVFWDNSLCSTIGIAHACVNLGGASAVYYLFGHSCSGQWYQSSLK